MNAIRKRLVGSLAALATVAGLAACSAPAAAPVASTATSAVAAPASSSAAASPSPSATKAALDFVAINKFVTLVFKRDYEAARPYVEAGSAAATYLDYQIIAKRAFTKLGAKDAKEKVSTTVDEATGTVHIKTTDQKVDWHTFTVSDSGKITGWSTANVGPLNERVFVDGPKTTVAGTTVTLLGGYRNEKFVRLFFEVKATRRIAIYQGFRVTGGGKSLKVSGSAYPGSMNPGSSYVGLQVDVKAMPEAAQIPIYDWAGNKLLGTAKLTVPQP